MHACMRVCVREKHIHAYMHALAGTDAYGLKGV